MLLLSPEFRELCTSRLGSSLNSDARKGQLRDWRPRRPVLPVHWQFQVRKRLLLPRSWQDMRGLRARKQGKMPKFANRRGEGQSRRLSNHTIHFSRRVPHAETDNLGRSPRVAIVGSGHSASGRAPHRRSGPRIR